MSPISTLPFLLFLPSPLASLLFFPLPPTSYQSTCRVASCSPFSAIFVPSASSLSPKCVNFLLPSCSNQLPEHLSCRIILDMHPYLPSCPSLLPPPLPIPIPLLLPPATRAPLVPHHARHAPVSSLLPFSPTTPLTHPHSPPPHTSYQSTCRVASCSTFSAIP
ncbi:unnamed protein product [Closterium sp. NIES-54]